MKLAMTPQDEIVVEERFSNIWTRCCPTWDIPPFVLVVSVMEALLSQKERSIYSTGGISVTTRSSQAYEKTQKSWK
jgi:hypothetical protein